MIVFRSLRLCVPSDSQRALNGDARQKLEAADSTKAIDAALGAVIRCGTFERLRFNRAFKGVAPRTIKGQPDAREKKSRHRMGGSHFLSGFSAHIGSELTRL